MNPIKTAHQALLAAAVVLSTALLGFSPASAQTAPTPDTTFSPAGATGAFGTVGNWSPGLPVAGDDALIDNGKTATMTQANADTLFGSLTLGTNSVISLAANTAAGLAGGSVVYFNNGSQLNYTSGTVNRSATYNILTGATVQMQLAGTTGNDAIPQGSLVGDNTTTVNFKVINLTNLRWSNASFTGVLNYQPNVASNARVVSLTSFGGTSTVGPGTTNFDGFVRATMGGANKIHDSGTLKLTGTSGDANQPKFDMGGSSDNIGNLTIDSPTGATVSAPTVRGSSALTVSGTTTFQGTAGAVNIDSNATYTINDLLTTGNLTFAGTGTWAVSGDGRIRLNAASGTRTVTTTADASISNILTGTQGFTKEGAGTLTLTGTNLYRGTATVNAGTLSVGNGTSSSALSDFGGLAVVSPAVVNLNYAGTDTVLSLSLGGSPMVAGQYGHTNSGADNGGAGVGFYDAFFAPSTGIINNLDGDTSSLGLVFWDGGTTNIVTNGNLIGAGGAGTWNTALTNWDSSLGAHVAWDNSGNDTAVFEGADGTVTLGVPITAAGITSSSTSTIQSNTLTLDVTSGTPVVNVAANTLTISSDIAGTDGLQKTGAGTLILTGNKGFSGGLTLSAGTLQVNNASGVFGTGTLTIGGGEIRSNANGQISTTTNNHIWNNSFSISRGATGTATFNFDGDVTLANNITLTHTDNTVTTRLNGDIGQSGGSRSLSVAAGGGSVILAGDNNTYTGATNLNSGTLQLAHINAIVSSSGLAASTGTTLQLRSDIADTFATPLTTLNTAGTSSMTIDVNRISSGSGNQLVLNGGLSSQQNHGNETTLNFTGGNSYTLSIPTLKVDRFGSGGGGGGIHLNPTGTSVAIGPVTSTSTQGLFLRLRGTSTGNTLGAISHSGAGALRLEKQESGTWTLTGAGNYTGAVAITLGSLRIANNTALGTTAGGVTQSGASELAIDGSGGAVTVGAEALSINGGGISNAGALRNIAGNNTYGGTVTLAAQSRINSDSGTLLLNHATSVTGAGQNLVVGGAGNVSISGAITTTTGFVAKDSAGTLTLSGPNTYTGATNINDGTLLVNGNQPTATGAVTVAANGTLGGIGTIGGATTVDGKLAPGNSGVGTLTFVTGGLTLGSLTANSLQFQLGADTTAGTTYDTVVTNTLDIGTLDFADFQFTDTGTLGAGVYTLISSGAAITGSIGTAGGMIGGLSGTLSVSGNNLILTVSGATTYTVTYDGNGSDGGAVPVDGNFYATGATVTVLANTGSLVRSNFVFSGWNTQADGLGTHYAATGSATFSMGSANTTLYAEWKTPYEAWAGGAAFGDDANGDGVNNGLAFLLGAANPNVDALGLLPDVSEDNGKLVLTFSCLNSAARGGAVMSVQYSNDMGLTDFWATNTAAVPGAATPVVPPNAPTVINGVTFEVTAGIGDLVDVTATVDASNALDGKLFGRVSAAP